MFGILLKSVNTLKAGLSYAVSSSTGTIAGSWMPFSAGIRLKSMQLISSSDTSEWLPGIEKYRRYRMVNGEKIVKSRLPNRCLRLWTNPVITWDGSVVPCCFDKNADHAMGNLNEQTFREIWNGKKYREFRSSVLTARKKIEICRNCTSGLANIKV